DEAYRARTDPLRECRRPVGVALVTRDDDPKAYALGGHANGLGPALRRIRARLGARPGIPQEVRFAAANPALREQRRRARRSVARHANLERIVVDPKTERMDEREVSFRLMPCEIPVRRRVRQHRSALARCACAERYAGEPRD